MGGIVLIGGQGVSVLFIFVEEGVYGVEAEGEW